MNRIKARKLRKAIVRGSQSLPDEVADTVPDLFDKWRTGTAYVVGDRRTYNGTLYKCLIAHTSQDTWTPDVAPSLWARTMNPAEEWPEWIQPTGATDAYMAGNKVAHNGKHWESTTDNNVWEPGVYGWNEVA